MKSRHIFVKAGETIVHATAGGLSNVIQSEMERSKWIKIINHHALLNLFIRSFIT